MANLQTKTDEDIDFSYDGDDNGGETGFSFTEYDISAVPNDFNITTLNNFINSGVVKIPGFQRNYVWDIKKASKLIESIILGIPIPQIFLFEQSKNKFIVIDGQQRYMTIYYFIKQRFPIEDKRSELRQFFDNNRGIPEEILLNDDYFIDFELQLPTIKSNEKPRFDKKTYHTLEEDDRMTFDLRTIRNVIIKQNSPNDGDSVIFEIFYRLNTGGVNLMPQEIRTSLFHSDFYDMLYRINLNPNWRKLAPSPVPDIHMKDIETLLRGFALLIDGQDYTPSMARFLNRFSEKMKKSTTARIAYLEELFNSFVLQCVNASEKLFYSAESNRFNISLFEAIFVALCSDAYFQNTLKVKPIDLAKVNDLKQNSDFLRTITKSTTSKLNVDTRIGKAKELL